MLSRTTVAVFLVAMAAAALGIGLMGAVGSASPKDNGDDGHNDGDKGGNLTVLTKTREEKVLDLGPQGPSQGDVRVLNAPLYNQSGKEKVGRLDLYCVLTDPSQKAQMTECTFTYTLPDGEISAQGISSRSTLKEFRFTSKADAITGGTQEYAGVRGEVRFAFRANEVTSTFHFVD